MRAFLIVIFSARMLACQQTFPSSCPGGTLFPLASLAVHHPIDDACPDLTGKPSSSEASHTQNSVKNNFCASGPPQAFTPQMLIDLQASVKDAGVSFGFQKEPLDRSKLTELHEGTLVRMKAYLIEAHFADLGSGESVNCNGSTVDDNDIHIALGDQPDAQECASVTAEITPHFRPTTWNHIGEFETYNKSTRKYTVNPQIASRLQAQPYRVTGQLFFDASHTPCPCGTSCSPSRSSLWEIHPVYAMDVCKTGTQCDENDDAQWLAFDQWWTNLAPIQPVKPSHTHAPHEHEPPTKSGHHTKTAGAP